MRPDSRAEWGEGRRWGRAWNSEVHLAEVSVGPPAVNSSRADGTLREVTAEDEQGHVNGHCLLGSARG